ncbi:MAG: hypothetical protein KGZ92_05520 [Firmicutes bacterium]|nr:hypothetical protein [Dethiobacter sp.]MBS3888748.1 hypothetical protein [Bacillota bacterium]MBS4055189.1 hypothetical protein [Thermaerobacter sp.]
MRHAGRLLGGTIALLILGIWITGFGIHSNDVDSGDANQNIKVTTEEMLEMSLRYGISQTRYFDLFEPADVFDDSLSRKDEIISLFLSRFHAHVSFDEEGSANTGGVWIFIPKNNVTALRYVEIDHRADKYGNHFFESAILFELEYLKKETPLVISEAGAQWAFPTRGISFVDSDGLRRLLGVGRQFSGYGPESFLVELQSNPPTIY